MNGFPLLLIFLFFQTGIGNLNRTATTNELKETAEEAYKQGNFEQASQLYSTLIDSFQVKSDPVRLNYAHSLRKSGQNQEADAAYRSLAANGKDKKARSIAYQQLGILAVENKNLQDATTYFKESLKANPENESVRYNYELARKMLQQQEEQEQEQEDKMEPSEWAKELKKQAEQLVKQYRFQEAYELMEQGLEQDPTVAAFQNFTNRIRTILEIEQQ